MTAQRKERENALKQEAQREMAAAALIPRNFCGRPTRRCTSRIVSIKNSFLCNDPQTAGSL